MMQKKSFLLILSFLLFIGIQSSASAQGYLIPTDQSLPPLGLKYQRVQVNIQGRAARTKITQVFVNSTNRLLEATFFFPLPKGATFSSFVLYINGKATKGKVLERNKAASIYNAIVRRMQDPGLIEHMGGGLFKARVFPIPRKGEQKLEISFTQLIPYNAGLHRYVYPLKTPRHALKTLQDFTLTVRLKSKTPLKNIYSPTHKIAISRKNDREAMLGFEKNKALLNRDFVLYYSVSPKDLGLNLLTYRKKGEDGYFLLMATPKTSYGSKELVSKNITFVLDTSGSMSGAKMKWAKIALASCLKKLNPNDNFNVIRFSTDVESLFEGYQTAGSGRVKKALAFVKKMEAAGGTAIDEALRMALAQKPVGSGVRIVVMITDGHPTIGVTEPKKILKNSQKSNKHSTRIFTFGIGSSINIHLLDKIAQQTNATGDYVKPNKEISSRISQFYDKVRYPVLSDIKMKVSKSIRLFDIYPKRIPDLFRGGQIVLFGRYRGKGHVALTLTGTVKGKQKSFVFESKFAEKNDENDFISRLWANRKVAYLLDNIRLHGVNVELKQEIIRLGKKFGIVTPYTSYLVVEGEKNTVAVPRPGQPLIQTNRGVTGAGKGRMRFAPKMRSKIRTRFNSRPAAPMKRMEMKANSGESAVDTSQRIRKMKKSKVVQGVHGARYVKGRLFRFKNGGWVDSGLKSSMKIIPVKYLSKTYFKLLQLRPDLKKFLALGRKVTIVVNAKTAIAIGRKDFTVGIKQLKKLLAK